LLKHNVEIETKDTVVITHNAMSNDFLYIVEQLLENGAGAVSGYTYTGFTQFPNAVYLVLLDNGNVVNTIPMSVESFQFLQNSSTLVLHAVDESPSSYTFNELYLFATYNGVLAYPIAHVTVNPISKSSTSFVSVSWTVTITVGNELVVPYMQQQFISTCTNLSSKITQIQSSVQNVTCQSLAGQYFGSYQGSIALFLITSLILYSPDLLNFNSQLYIDLYQSTIGLNPANIQGIAKVVLVPQGNQYTIQQNAVTLTPPFLIFPASTYALAIAYILWDTVYLPLATTSISVQVNQAQFIKLNIVALLTL